MARRLVLTCMCLAAAAACGGKNDAGPDAATSPDASTTPDAGICPTAQQLVYFGTSKPTYVPLTPGQILAIGSMTTNGPGDIYCSGTLIAPRWVLTANHCGVAVGHTFCAGEDSTTAKCVAVKSVYSEPYAGLSGSSALLDLTLVELTDDAVKTIPGIEPIPLWQGDEAPLLNARVEIAGYGSTQTNSYNIRYFAAETIDAVGPADDGAQWLRVNAGGDRGPCDGDSGGPALVLDAHCQVRVAGALTWGDNPYGSSFCPGQDRYTRTDIAMSWITAHVGSTDGACGTIDAAGQCDGHAATYCDGGTLKHDDCSATSCGWSGTGFRCIPSTDPCGGESAAGRCVGNVAHWCAAGTPITKDCTADGGKKCVYDVDQRVTTCDVDPCMGYDFAGTCMSNKLYYCDLGQLQIIDCAAQNKTCGPVQGGNDCK